MCHKMQSCILSNVSPMIYPDKYFKSNHQIGLFWRRIRISTQETHDLKSLHVTMISKIVSGTFPIFSVLVRHVKEERSIIVKLNSDPDIRSFLGSWYSVTVFSLLHTDPGGSKSKLKIFQLSLGCSFLGQQSQWHIQVSKSTILLPLHCWAGTSTPRQLGSPTQHNKYMLFCHFSKRNQLPGRLKQMSVLLWGRTVAKECSSTVCP